MENNIALAESLTQVGDLYELGKHRLVCGDSRDKEVADRALGGLKPLLMVTDPPYGINYDYTNRKRCDEFLEGKVKCKTGKVINDYIFDWTDSYKNFPGEIAYVWHAANLCVKSYKNLEDIGFVVKQQIIWKKSHFALNRYGYHWKHESCWFAIRKGCKYHWRGDRRGSTVWDINCMQKGHNLSEDMNTDHSTQKPLECMWRPIRNHLDKDGDDVVYDPFLGSGTTLIAAERHGVGCIGIEISGSYCDMIVRRWIKERRKMDLSADVFRNGERCDLFAKEESDPVYLWQLKEKS